ncbi:Uncharacterized protein dnm_086900 [Desulfonema magnum]|uniref:Uncharacterized protein n=1 Tax=Desulfonema magnum TaxID=45655 RepID=A0A975BWT7_9BACT|nr:Uncharacterized protein dnm_086900 [Desulfonema magnum]
MSFGFEPFKEQGKTIRTTDQTDEGIAQIFSIFEICANL